MSRYWKLLVCLSLSVGACGIRGNSDGSGPPAYLPIETSTLFAGSGRCANCHGGVGDVFIDEQGNDISPAGEWRSSMMAHAAVDPYFQAQVAAEILENPTQRAFIEDKCTTCHAPMGRTEAVQVHKTPYTMEQMREDPLALDGVSCTACHQIQETSLGTPDSYSGQFVIDGRRRIYGPYRKPLQSPMVNHVNYLPQYGAQVQDAALCGSCHTLFTPTLDANGNVIGSFPEQTPYLEWRNSHFAKIGQPCQSCHMPADDEPRRISTMPAWLNVLRTPYWHHTFIGGNALMLGILRDNHKELGLRTDPAALEWTRLQSIKQLQNEAATLSVDGRRRDDGSLILNVTVRNRTGHKLPTGFPSRRVWLHVTVTDGENGVLFESGAWNAEGEIRALDEPYEPHHALITSQDQIAVYESVMQDVDGNVTWSLLRAAGYRKDNRIPPLGFRAVDNDTIAVKGAALEDPDFNRNGSGLDVVQYRLPIATKEPVLVQVELCYQSIKPRHAGALFAHQAESITQFAGMYQRADKAPIIMQRWNATLP